MDTDLKQALWRLAFEAHRDGGTDDAEAVSAGIGELPLDKSGAALHPRQSRDWAQHVIEVDKAASRACYWSAPPGSIPSHIGRFRSIWRAYTSPPRVILLRPSRALVDSGSPLARSDLDSL